MAPVILHPTSHLSHGDILRLTQNAPKILSVTPKDKPETWTTLENLFIVCVHSGEDASARKCLDLLTKRFGETNERVVSMKGVYEEAIATNDEALERALKFYNDALAIDPTLFVSFTLLSFLHPTSPCLSLSASAALLC
jgi:ER membrane protein complex subunit 2